jgi:hypothetical protein
VFKVNTLEWLGHGVRMDCGRAAKKLLEGKSGGGRGKEEL